MPKKMIWMAVTPDEYEDVLFVADTCYELADMIGVKPQTVRRNLWYWGHQYKNGLGGRPTKYRIVNVEDD